MPKKAPPKKRTTKKNNTDSETLYKNGTPKNLTELKTYYDGTGKLPKNTIIILQDENGKQRVYNSFDEFKNGTPEERKLEQIYANKINENGRKLELAKKNKNSDEIKRLEKESLQLHREQESIYRSRLSRMGDITLKGDLVSIASSYKDGKLVIKSEKYYHQLNSEEIALGLELLDHSSKVEQFYKPEVVNVGQRESHVGIKQDNINNPKITGEITNKKIDIKPVRQEKEDFQKRYERIKNNYYEQISNNYKNLTEHEKEVFQNYERTGWKGQYSGGPSNAGKIFDNDGRDGGEILPKKLGLEYREYDINIKVGPTRDDYRFVRGSDGSVYYTNNHYRTFIRVK